MARKLAPFNLKWLEEPVWPPEDHAGLARVQAQGGIPTAAGENAMLPEFKGLLEAGSVTYAQPSVTKVGGVTQIAVWRLPTARRGGLPHSGTGQG